VITAAAGLPTGTVPELVLRVVAGEVHAVA
jgi:hypothetical protein